MPPKVKFSKEAIIGTALQLVREQGMASLTARALAEKLGATPRVIFGQFANMAELQAEVIGAAEMVVVEYIRKALEDEKPFRSVGVAYILFASKEPQLFQLLFQNPSKDPIRRFQDFLPMKDHSKWKDYSNLDMKKDSYWANACRANKWGLDDMYSRLGKPVDKDEWLMKIGRASCRERV